ncbi:MAG: hypothetical protein V1723_03315 [Candidatus Uhrbacteria bacterium]
MRSFSFSVLFVLLLGVGLACGYDYGEEDNATAASSPAPAAQSDGGTKPTTSVPCTPPACSADAQAFTLTCIAPDSVGLVTMKANVGGGWDAVATGSNGRATWVTRLDAARLAKGPCRADDVGKSCGYTLNCEYPGHVPGWGVTQDSGGTLRVAGDLAVSGPLAVVRTPVDNGIRGGNYWLHSP